jgi:hypothetical protein
MKLKLSGGVFGGKVYITYPKKYSHFFPNYFTIEIDTNKIVERDKKDKLYKSGKHKKSKLI